MPVHPDIVVQAWTNKRLREEHQLPQADAGQAWPGASVPAIYGGPAAYWAAWMDCRSSVPAVRRPLPSLSGGTPTTTRRALAASGGGGLDCRASARLRLGPRNRTDESCVERNLRLMPEGQPPIGSHAAKKQQLASLPYMLQDEIQEFVEEASVEEAEEAATQTTSSAWQNHDDVEWTADDEEEWQKDTHRDYYEALGLTRSDGTSISASRVRAAYHRMVQKWHPNFQSIEKSGSCDHENGPQRTRHEVLRRFWLITEAYLVLKDPERRRIYDDCGFAHFKQSEACYQEPVFEQGGRSFHGRSAFAIAMRRLLRPGALLRRLPLLPRRTFSSSAEEARPSVTNLRRHFIVCAVPMVGFGVMDNTIMIHAGEMIDENLGMALGLSTMASAAAGQVISDFSGVCFGGTLEAAASKLGLRHPALSDKQRQMSVVKLLGTAGSAIGVLCGCLLGMLNLLFLDLRKVERQKKHAELQTICKTFAVDGPAHFEAERCTLYIRDSEDKYLWTFAKRWQLSDAQLSEFKSFTEEQDYSDGAIASALAELHFKASEIAHLVRKSKEVSSDEFRVYLEQQLERPTRIKLRAGGTKKYVVDAKKLLNTPVVYSDPRFAATHRNTGSGTRACSVLVCPILSKRSGEVLGVLEVINKMPKRPQKPVFTEMDEKLALMMCSHVASIVDTICDEDSQLLEFLGSRIPCNRFRDAYQVYEDFFNGTDPEARDFLLMNGGAADSGSESDDSMEGELAVAPAHDARAGRQAEAGEPQLPPEMAKAVGEASVDQFRTMLNGVLSTTLRRDSGEHEGRLHTAKAKAGSERSRRRPAKKARAPAKPHMQAWKWWRGAGRIRQVCNKRLEGGNRRAAAQKEPVCQNNLPSCKTQTAAEPDAERRIACQLCNSVIWTLACPGSDANPNLSHLPRFLGSQLFLFFRHGKGARNTVQENKMTGDSRVVAVAAVAATVACTAFVGTAPSKGPGSAPALRAGAAAVPARASANSPTAVGAAAAAAALAGFGLAARSRQQRAGQAKTPRHFFGEPETETQVAKVTAVPVTQHPPGSRIPYGTPTPHPMAIRKRPRRNRRMPAQRNMFSETRLTAANFILPIFVHEGTEDIPISSMPDVSRVGVDTGLLREVEEAVKLGVKSVVLFPKTPDELKTQTAEECFNPAGLAQRAISNVKKAFPDVALLPHFTYMCRNLVVDFV
eukprot:s856_g20.t1